MANFSDDEPMFQVDSILEQRKRKGILEYLVRWKDATTGQDTSWEPADTIAADCAKAVKAFIKSKAQKKKSPSKTRKPSRSRSRSSSRSRNTAEKTTPTRRSTRSRSKGRTSKTPVEDTKAVEEKSEEKVVEQVAEKSEAKSVEVSQSVSASTSISSSSTTTTVVQSESESSMSEKVQTGRVLRSSTLAAREKLEVQRVHNEQRPVREDDGKPRSSIWKVADYAVIALFILSVIAAIFLFVEKFVDLENFKKQAFPNMSVLKSRLGSVVNNLVELVQAGADRVSDAWLYLIGRVGGGSEQKASS